MPALRLKKGNLTGTCSKALRSNPWYGAFKMYMEYLGYDLDQLGHHKGTRTNVSATAPGHSNSQNFHIQNIVLWGQIYKTTNRKKLWASRDCSPKNPSLDKIASSVRLCSPINAAIGAWQNFLRKKNEPKWTKAILTFSDYIRGSSNSVLLKLEISCRTGNRNKSRHKNASGTVKVSL